MTEERDPKVSSAYRELGAEEPPRALDDAILAAARRGRQRWYAPLAAAAVLVLAVAVTLQMQLERPGIESPVQHAAKASPPIAQAELKLKVEAQLGSATKRAAKEMTATQRKDAGQLAPAAPAAPAAREPQPFAAEQAAASAGPTMTRSDDSRGAASSVTGTLARQMEERISRGAQATQQAPKQADTPERELERIAALRAQGRHDEADRALAEFRKRYADFRIPEAMRERLERR